MLHRMRDIVLDGPGLGSVEHPCRQPGGALQQPVPLAGAGRGADGLEELADDPVGEAALQGEPARGEHPAVATGAGGP